MTREKLLLELRRAFGVQRDAVGWAEQNQQPVAVVGRLHFRDAGVRVAVWTGLDWVPVRDLAELSEVLADAGALRHAPALDQS
ncbi:hypothetical protein DEIGR_310078 [Deinococcus grandis]|uniref:Uncharacterized protein n=1 Tax=Deinococcus grandis TaxID=57498 RepID=A0A100HMQ3_9DEIO|nr:hypothetical protein [Deinococcus grandis]BBN97178.1 hypothetical protein DEGR_39110 [Deinococcus grandis]GAQ23559.1 hypothetical protein DEIGR_310078 [Deinococcus grandis]